MSNLQKYELRLSSFFEMIPLIFVIYASSIINPAQRPLLFRPTGYLVDYLDSKRLSVSFTHIAFITFHG